MTPPVTGLIVIGLITLSGWVRPVSAQDLAMLRDPTAPVRLPTQPVAGDGGFSPGGQMLEILGMQKPTATPLTDGLQGKLQALTGGTAPAADTASEEDGPEPGTVGLRMVVRGGFEEDAHAAAFHDNAWYRVGSGTRIKTVTEVTQRGARFRSNGVDQFLRVVEHAVTKVRLTVDPQ